MKKKLKGKIIERFGSQVDFAQALGIDETIVSRVINGRRKLSEEGRALWCRALKCRPDVFQEETE